MMICQYCLWLCILDKKLIYLGFCIILLRFMDNLDMLVCVENRMVLVSFSNRWHTLALKKTRGGGRGNNLMQSNSKSLKVKVLYFAKQSHFYFA
mmetsp:Transcript_34086/g.51407  ORF Transcript_34086/g.51407 Transcript_34086/m.51407 type:complete len:94 (+) Transcript_34086:113-394(+)